MTLIINKPNINPLILISDPHSPWTKFHLFKLIPINVTVAISIEFLECCFYSVHCLFKFSITTSGLSIRIFLFLEKYWNEDLWTGFSWHTTEETMRMTSCTSMSLTRNLSSSLSLAYTFLMQTWINTFKLLRNSNPFMYKD